jgi:hypothetical protein
MDKLEKIFHDTIHSGKWIFFLNFVGFQSSEFLGRFFGVLDKRLNDFMESVNDKILQRENTIPEDLIPGDFQFGQLRYIIISLTYFNKGTILGKD